MVRPWVLLLATLSLSPSVRADLVQGTRNEALTENAHQLDITLAPSHARMRVRRRVYNPGPRHDQAVFLIDLPPFAVATGLATLGTKDGRPFWFRGELMEAEAAAEKYEELTGLGIHVPKDPALLWWRGQSSLTLQVFPCAPSANKWIEYTLDVPTRYERGRYFIELGPVGTDALAAVATLSASRPGDRVLVSGEPHVPGSMLRLDAEKPVRIELERRAAPRFDAEFAAFEFGDERVLTRYRVAAAPRLSDVPRHARVVLLLDGSHSLSAGERLSAIRAARAYLARFPGSSVEIVTFDREPHARFGRLVAVTRALEALAHLQILPQNGSALESALGYADRVLAREPQGAARRILVLSDTRTRTRLTPELLVSSLPKSRALVHIGVIDDEGDWLDRNDAHRFSAVARGTGGLVWSASSTAESELEERERMFEAWVRPISLDNVTLTPSEDELGSALSYEMHSGDPGLTQLREGEALDRLGILERSRLKASLRGELWAQPVELSFKASETAARRWSALVFGTALFGELSEPEMMVLARHGGVVSPVTSYLAIEPGVRPSTEGLDGEGGIGLTGTGEGGGGVGVGLEYALPQLDRKRYLEDTVRRVLADCGARDRAATVAIETTLHEIVDLLRLELSGVPDPKLDACVSERIWSVALPGQFDEESATFEIVTRG